MNFIVVNDLMALNTDHIIRVDYHPPNPKGKEKRPRVEVYLTEHGKPLAYVGEDAERLWARIWSLVKQ